VSVLQHCCFGDSKGIWFEKCCFLQRPIGDLASSNMTSWPWKIRW